MQMKIIDEKQLKIIIENHKHWLNKDCDDWENMKADLRFADLEDADLRCVNLKGADLRFADIIRADLSDANFEDANFYCACIKDANLANANLNNANLANANLYNANLRNANLQGAYFRVANLSHTNLMYANLSNAILIYANLSNAILMHADISGADTRDANIFDVDFRGAKNVPYIPMSCPEEGDFIGWKKAKVSRGNVIVKLSIPADAKRSSATSRKCRCNKAKVLEIYNIDGTVAIERKCHSCRDRYFIYEVGKTVEVGDFNEDRWNECSQGIHFFINRQEAINYL